MKISNGARVNGGREPLEKPIYDRLNSKYAAHGAPFRPCNGQPKNQRSSGRHGKLSIPTRSPNIYPPVGVDQTHKRKRDRDRDRERKRESREQRATEREREKERHLHGGFAISKGFQRCGATAATLFDYEP